MAPGAGGGGGLGAGGGAAQGAAAEARSGPVAARLPPPPTSYPVATPYRWKPSWRRFGPWDYVGTAAVLGGFYAVESMHEPSESDWNRPLPFDRRIRDALVADSRQGRALADDWSDIFWYASVAYPVVTTLSVPSLRGGARGAAMSFQMTMMNLEAFAVVSLLTRLPHKAIGRARPNSRGCAEDPEYSEQCDRPAQLVSFWGGHTAISMTGAGLACAHHLNAGLYGSPLADGVACGAAVAAGQAVNFLRLAADKHWISDNLIGSLVGFGFGFGMPTFLHYRPFWRPKGATAMASAPAALSGVQVALMPVLSPGSAGASLAGAF